MQLNTTNIRSVQGNASIRLDGITALCGPVGSGKSSILTAAAAALMGAPVPGTAKPSKADLGEIITKGQYEAGAALVSRNPDGAVHVLWPAGTVQRTGMTVSATPAACGLLNILEMKSADRATALSVAIKADLTEHDVRVALEADGAGPVVIAAVLADFKRLGCDGALEYWQTSGRKAKGAWEAVTGPGTKYGSKVAAEWRPDGWEADLAGASLKDLERAVIDAEAALGEAQKRSGASEARIADLTDKVSKLVGCRSDIERTDRDLQRASKRSIEAARTLSNTPKPAPIGVNHLCPHCGTAIVGSGPYQVATQVDESKHKRLTDAYEKARKAASEAEDEARAATVADTEARRTLRELEAAKREFERAMEVKRQGNEPDEISLDSASEAYHIAKSRLAAFNSKSRADVEHQKVLDAVSIVKLLAPDGIRKRKMAEALESFNNRLAYLCEQAEQGVVQLTPELTATYCGRHYDSLSTGEAFLARTTLQVAIAQFDGSQALIIDIDRPLDAWASNSVIQMLDTVVHEEGSPFKFALLALTLTKPKSSPNLGNLGPDCLTYWVENGRCFGTAFNRGYHQQSGLTRPAQKPAAVIRGHP